MYKISNAYLIEIVQFLVKQNIFPHTILICSKIIEFKENKEKIQKQLDLHSHHSPNTIRLNILLTINMCHKTVSIILILQIYFNI